MPRLLEVGRRMPVGGTVATADLAAGKALPQMHPPGPGLQALLAAVDPIRRLGDLDPVEMSARRGAHDEPTEKAVVGSLNRCCSWSSRPRSCHPDASPARNAINRWSGANSLMASSNASSGSSAPTAPSASLPRSASCPRTLWRRSSACSLDRSVADVSHSKRDGSVGVITKISSAASRRARIPKGSSPGPETDSPAAMRRRWAIADKQIRFAAAQPDPVTESA
jgi:hypothetical protein